MPKGVYKHGHKVKYWLGKKRSEETKRKISNSLKRNTNGFRGGHGKIRTDESYKKAGLKFKGRKIFWADKISKAQRGEKGNNWKGGIYQDRHNGDWRYRKWRDEVFKRDNFTCWTCGKRGGYLEAHHIKSWAKYPKLRFIISNGMTLHKECHQIYG